MTDEQKLAHYEALRTYAAALEAERDALAVQFDMEREEHRKGRVALRLWQEQAADLRKERDALAAKVARVEALAAQWEADAANARESFSMDTSRNVHFYSAFLCGGHAEDLRAALADPALDGPPVGERIYTLPPAAMDLPSVCDRCYEPLTQYVLRDNSALCLRCAGIATGPDGLHTGSESEDA